MKKCPVCNQNDIPTKASVFAVCNECYEKGNRNIQANVEGFRANIKDYLNSIESTPRERELEQEVQELKEHMSEIQYELDTYKKEIERLYQLRRLK